MLNRAASWSHPSRWKSTMAQLHSFNNLVSTLPPAPFVEWGHFLPSRAADIALCVDRLMRFLTIFANKFGATGEIGLDIETALREVLSNAIIRRNREDPCKQVYVICRCSMDGEITICVQDEGQGFDNRSLLDPT